MSIKKELRRAVDSGKVLFGVRETEKSILNDSAKLIIIAHNCPEREKNRIIHLAKIARIPLVKMKENAYDIGELCGKPFSIAAMAIIDEGKSKILNAVNKDETNA
ncbi:MAG: 50S ribosomal protein L30e [Candidatus Diapherotrites archaeon]|nr:50S ribosomal protein L30e [Candidatus Diapherotrites archaeon]